MIAEQEFLLGAMIAAAKSRGLGWCKGSLYRNANGEPANAADVDVASCCALGAMGLAGQDTCYFDRAVDGNDRDKLWEGSTFDDGESLGWAFRCAMEND